MQLWAMLLKTAPDGGGNDPAANICPAGSGRACNKHNSRDADSRDAGQGFGSMLFRSLTSPGSYHAELG